MAQTAKQTAATAPAMAAPPSRCPLRFSWSNLVTLAMVVYICMVTVNLYRVANPMSGVQVPPDAVTVDPLWPPGTRLAMQIFLTDSPQFRAQFLNRSDPTSVKLAPLIGEANDLVYGPQMASTSFQLRLLTPGAASDVAQGAGEGVKATVLSPQLWRVLHGNRTVFMHVLLSADGHSVDPSSPSHDALKAMLAVVPLVKHGPRKPDKPLRYLLTESGAVVREAHKLREAGLPSHIAFWAEEVGVRLVADWTRYPHDFMPLSIAHALEWYALDSRGRPLRQPRDGRGAVEASSFGYKPPLHVSRIGSDQYVPLNETVRELPLKVTVESMSMQRWQLMQSLAQGLDQQKELLGFGDKDIDEMRGLITDTNVILLCVTLLASTLHLLMEFLAFRADVSFWKSSQSLRGLSGRSVAVDLFFQFVVLLDLLQEDASLLITVPSAIGVVIQAWKLKRALAMMRTAAAARPGTAHGAINGAPAAAATKKGKAQRKDAAAEAPGPSSEVAAASRSASACPFASPGAALPEPGATCPILGLCTVVDNAATAAAAAKEEALSAEADRTAMLHLGAVLTPVVVGYSLKLLLFHKHTGWYSWVVSSAVGFVYAAGFVMMTPQLYINRRLKSVAHMPWKRMAYKASSTFIDDLFAFVIKMPTVHRLSCFRDDLVFVVFLYQRWIYPVDATRAMEGGGSSPEEAALSAPQREVAGNGAAAAAALSASDKGAATAAALAQEPSKGDAVVTSGEAAASAVAPPKFDDNNALGDAAKSVAAAKRGGARAATFKSSGGAHGAKQAKRKAGGQTDGGPAQGKSEREY